jgi:peptidyl-prolyl cis-trans isomerase D
VVPPLEELKGKIEQDLRNQKAQAVFGPLAQKFQDKVFEQGDTFKDIADEAKTPAVTSQWLTRSQVQAVAMGNTKLVSAVFSSSTIASKKNTEAIEIAPNTLMSARVVEHKPAATRPYEEVKNEVFAELKRKGAADLAKKTGEERLAKLVAGQDAGLGPWPAATQITRSQRAPGLTEDLAKAVFNLPADKLPAVIGGVSDQGGFAFVRLSKVNDPAHDEAKVRAAAQRAAGVGGGDLNTAYLGVLKTQIKNETRKELIEKKDDPLASNPSGAKPADGKKGELAKK